MSGEQFPDEAGIEIGVPSYPFPDSRTYRWMPRESMESLLPDFGIVVTQDVLQSVDECVAENLDHEIGGFLLRQLVSLPQLRPRVPHDRPVFAGSIQRGDFDPFIANSSDLECTDGGVARQVPRQAVGGLVSLSPPDEACSSPLRRDPTRRPLFLQEWMCALVIEPERKFGGFFGRRGGKLNPERPVEFYEYLQGQQLQSRKTVMCWSDYICLNPLSDEEMRPQVACREPVKTPQPEFKSIPFPSRTYLWTPSAVAEVGRADVTLVATQEVWLKCKNMFLRT